MEQLREHGAKTPHDGCAFASIAAWNSHLVLHGGQQRGYDNSHASRYYCRQLIAETLACTQGNASLSTGANGHPITVSKHTG